MVGERFCPICGRTGVKFIGNICADCYRKEHPLAEVKRVKDLRVVICRYCLSYFIEGRWHRRHKRVSSPHEYVRYIIESKIVPKVLVPKGEVSSIETDIEYSDVYAMQSLSTLTVEAVVKVKGRAHPELDIYEEVYKFPVKVVFDVCPVCRDVALKKEKALLQVRAKGRKLTEEEIRTVKSIVNSVIASLEEQDREARIVEVRGEAEGYLDVVLLSPNVARTIAYTLKKMLVGDVIESHKVVGMTRSGKPLTKVTVRFLLPRPKKGDIVKARNGTYLILDYENGKARAFSVEKGAFESLTKGEVMDAEVITSIDNLPRGLAISVRGREVQVMRYDNYQTIDALKVGEIEQNDEVALFEYNNRIYAIGKLPH